MDDVTYATTDNRLVRGVSMLDLSLGTLCHHRCHPMKAQKQHTQPKDLRFQAMICQHGALPQATPERARWYRSHFRRLNIDASPDLSANLRGDSTVFNRRLLHTRAVPTNVMFQ